MIKHMANIVRLMVIRKGLKSRMTEYMSMISEHYYEKEEESLIKIDELLAYSDYVLEFMKWALRV